LSARPQPYSDRLRLAEQIADARLLLAQRGEIPALGWPSRCGALEAMLKMVCDTAERVAAEEEKPA